MDGLVLYNLILLALLLQHLGIAFYNRYRFDTIRPEDRPHSFPSVSVLIPARNEVDTIGPCLVSLLQQDYPEIEVIVLDDDSTDGTTERLEELRESFPLLRIIRGRPLPEGWLGKNWACQQLASAATGEILFFTDADTVHRPQSVTSYVGTMERLQVRFLSGLPRQIVDTFWERVIVPMAPFLYFTWLPTRLIRTNRNPAFAAANGQILGMERSAYAELGGHESVRDQIVDDVELIRRAKHCAIPAAFALAVETVECRMYRSLPEIIGGFSKNFFTGLGKSIPLLAITSVHALLLYVVPWVVALYLLLQDRLNILNITLVLLQIATGIIIRTMLSATLRISRLQAFLHPLSILMTVAIGINSAYVTLSSGGPVWKGRSYQKGTMGIETKGRSSVPRDPT